MVVIVEARELMQDFYLQKGARLHGYTHRNCRHGRHLFLSSLPGSR